MNPACKIAWKKACVICLPAILLALCSAFIYMRAATKNLQWLARIPEVPVTANDPNFIENTGEMVNDYWTVAVFGLDGRKKGPGQGSSAGTQLLCSINRTSGAVRLVPVNRRTYLLNDPTGDSYGKLSQAYEKQGVDGNVAALNTNLDMIIDDYVVFDWNAVVDLINLLGGVDIELTKAEFYYINAYVTETVAETQVPSRHIDSDGMQHLDGVQAVAYMRIELMGSDNVYMERQSRVISQMIEKAKSMDADDLLQIIQIVVPQFSTSMDQSSLLEIGSSIKQYKFSSDASFPFTYETAQIENNGYCVIPNTLESNVEQLHLYLYQKENYVCSDRVKEISREIADGTTNNQGD